MRRYSERHGLHTLSELNITPLLDLAFVLLIIFMITTPLMENSVDLVLPTSETAKNPVNTAAVQTIAIDQHARVELNGEPTTLEQLPPQLAALKAQNADTAVVVRSHKELSVQRLMEVMDAIQRAEIKRVGVVTNPNQP